MEDLDEHDQADQDLGLPDYTYRPPSNFKLPGGGRYLECLKNHAVGIAGHAVDGCCEFMPSGEYGTLDALRCAACNCHRNFHRKELSGAGRRDPSLLTPAPSVGFYPPYYRTPVGYLHHLDHHMTAAPGLWSTSGGGGSREEKEDVLNMLGPSSSMESGKKRCRTKFSEEQKDKMLGFAEKLGWRIQRHDDGEVERFCSEVCVKRGVFKVWMHNNKHSTAIGKKLTPPSLGQ